MPSLDRTFALYKRQDGPVVIAEQLNFDVTGAIDSSFEINGGIAERRLRLGTCGADGSSQLRALRPEPHPFATATRDGLDHDRVADPVRNAGNRGVWHIEAERLLRARHD